jgi:hypothetical protein
VVYYRISELGTQHIFLATFRYLVNGSDPLAMHTKCGRVVNKSFLRFGLSSSCVVYLIKLPFLFCIVSFFFYKGAPVISKS